MEISEPNIDVEAAAAELFVAANKPFSERCAARARFRALLAQAWEEGRWSPPGPVANPYGVGLPAPRADQQGFPGLRLLRLREAATAALAWVENMAPTVRRTALAEQLRSALGGAGK